MRRSRLGVRVTVPSTAAPRECLCRALCYGDNPGHFFFPILFLSVSAKRLFFFVGNVRARSCNVSSCNYWKLSLNLNTGLNELWLEWDSYTEREERGKIMNIGNADCKLAVCDKRGLKFSVSWKSICSAYILWNLLGNPSFGFHYGLAKIPVENLGNAYVCTFFRYFCFSTTNRKGIFAKITRYIWEETKMFWSDLLAVTWQNREGIIILSLGFEIICRLALLEYRMLEGYTLSAPRNN